MNKVPGEKKNLYLLRKSPLTNVPLFTQTSKEMELKPGDKHERRSDKKIVFQTS